MIKLFQKVVIKGKSLQHLGRFNYFKDNLALIYQNQSSSRYLLREINSIKDEKIFQEESKKISNQLNEFTSALYDKQNIINPLKIQGEYTPNECQFIGDILLNRLLFINLRIKKIQQQLEDSNIDSDKKKDLLQNYMQYIILALDLFNFSILCCCQNGQIIATFSRIFSEWMEQFKSLNQEKDIYLNQKILISLSRIFQSEILSQSKILNKLNFDIFECTTFLMQLLSLQKNLVRQENVSQTENIENTEQEIELLDIQIEILDRILKIQEQSTIQIKKIDSASEFKQQFKENQFYRFWIDIENQEEDQGNFNETNKIENELVQKSSIDILCNYLAEEVFDGILIKRKIQNPNNLIRILSVFRVKKLNGIPSESLIHQIEQNIKNKDIIIKFVEQLTQKEIYKNNINQKAAFYNSFYNIITTHYLSSLNSYLNNNLRYENLNESNKSQQNNQVENQNKLNLLNIADIFKIMYLSCVVNYSFLNLLETTLNQNNQIQKLKHQEFIKILSFYSSFPLEMEILTKNQINFYLNKHFEKMNNQQKIQCSLDMLKLENQPEAPLYQLVQRPLFCTIENMSLITDFIMQFNSQPNKTLQEKIQFYFLIQTFFKDQIKISKHFEQQITDLKEAFIRAGFSKISEFQKQILKDLIQQDKLENPTESQLKNVEQELFLEDIFSIDYLINEDIVVEINGPTHYYLVSELLQINKQYQNQNVNEIDTFEDSVNFNTFALLENRNTKIKSTILSKLYKYKVKNIPFITYQKYKFLNKHTQLVYEFIFSNKSLKDLQKII